MKKIKLTQDKWVFVDDEDFEWLNQWKWCIRNGYAARSLGKRKNKKHIYMHRVIMDCPKRMEIDHIDGNILNNQKENLRIVSRSQNLRNSKKRNGCSSQYKGVSWYKNSNPWVVHITYNYKCIYIGYFKTEHQAALVYDLWALGLFGKYAKLNFQNIIAHS